MATTLLQNFQTAVLERLKGSNKKKCLPSHSCRCRKFVEKNRLLIFKDDHLKGRKVMYDSLMHPKDSAGKCHVKSTDTKLIGEMMFGVIPMPQKVSMLKVHTIQSPPQLMVTKVFVPVPSNCESSGEHESFDFYSIQCDEATIPLTMCNSTTIPSLPVSVPDQLSSSYCDDSGFSASASSSMSSLGPSPCGSFTGKSNSRSRRLERHRTTMLENSLQQQAVELVPLAKRPVKIGVGIIFMLDEDNPTENERFLNFFFSHIILIESYVNKLKQSIDEALKARSKSVIHTALDRFFNSVYALYSAPRIVEPVWLSMMTSNPRRSNLCSRFFNDLMFFGEKYDTKSTNFFLSSLLTGVLTHHLSWTQTVAPVGSGPSKTYLNKSHAKWLNSLGRSHPYNPLWAQLGDLYGAIGFPRRLSRTVVVGKDEQLVRKLLNVLSYFIRCSEILESQESFPPVFNSTLSSPTESVRTTVSGNNSNNHTNITFGGDVTSSDSSQKGMKLTGQVQSGKTVMEVNDKQKQQFCCDEALSGPQSLIFLRTDVPDSSWNAIEKSETFDCHIGRFSNSSVVHREETADSVCCKASSESLQVLHTTESVPSHSRSEIVPCRLSDKTPEENVKIEQIITVKSDAFITKNVNCEHIVSTQQTISRSIINERPSSLALTVRTIPLVTRTDSMYDDYDHIKLPDVFENETKAEYIGTFDEIIMSEPCPDVSHISVPLCHSTQASRTSSCCEPVSPTNTSSGIAPSSFLESDNSIGNGTIGELDSEPVNFFNNHYALGGDHLTDVPDGPSKQLICSTIELVHAVCADRASLQSDDDADEVDYISQWKSEPPVKPTKLVHPTTTGPSSSGSMTCRSITPSDFIRPHRSSTASSETTCIEPCENLVELTMPPCLDCVDDATAVPSHDSNFGRSLIADYCESYQSDFVLHGTRDSCFLKNELHQDLQMALKNSVLEEPIDEASCIVADLDNCTVKLYSCKYNSPKDMKTQELISSQLVGRTLESCQEFRKMNVTPEFCLMHLEDQLQSIYVKSEMLVEYIVVHRKLYHQELMALHEFDLSDMPLLLAVASTHSDPHLLLSLTDASVCRR